MVNDFWKLKLYFWVLILYLFSSSIYAAPEIAAHPANPFFGQVLQTTTETMTITVSNVGDTNDLNITSITTINLPFAMGVDNCSGQILAVNATCTFTISYTPPGVGDDADTFYIISNDPDNSGQYQLPLEGSGVDTLTNLAPTSPILLTPIDDAIDLDSASINFSWEKSTDSEGDALTYTLEVCENSSFSVGCITPVVVSKGYTAYMYAAISGSTSFMMLGLFSPYRTKRKKSFFATAIIVTSMFLASCGGGGGGSGSGPGAGNLNEAVEGLSSNTLYYWKVTVDDGVTSVDSEIRSLLTAF